MSVSWCCVTRAALASLAVSGGFALWGMPIVRPALAQQEQQQDRPGTTAPDNTKRSCRVLIRAPAAPRAPTERPTQPDLGGGIARHLREIGCAPGDVLLVAGAGLNAAAIAADFCDLTQQVVVSQAERTAAPPVVTLACVYAGARREPRGRGQDL